MLLQNTIIILIYIDRESRRFVFFFRGERIERVVAAYWVTYSSHLNKQNEFSSQSSADFCHFVPQIHSDYDLNSVLRGEHQLLIRLSQWSFCQSKSKGLITIPPRILYVPLHSPVTKYIWFIKKKVAQYLKNAEVINLKLLGYTGWDIKNWLEGCQPASHSIFSCPPSKTSLQNLEI